MKLRINIHDKINDDNACRGDCDDDDDDGDDDADVSAD